MAHIEAIEYKESRNENGIFSRTLTASVKYSENETPFTVGEMPKLDGIEMLIHYVKDGLDRSTPAPEIKTANIVGEPTPRTASVNANRATDAQIRLLRKLNGSLKADKLSILERYMHDKHRDLFDDLTVSEASELITKLKG